MKNNDDNRPRFSRWLLSRFRGFEDHFVMAGDLDEEFDEIVREQGLFRARLWYWQQVLFSLPPYIKFKMVWTVIMFKNYFMIALRYTRKQKAYAFINVSGLAIGLACVILIGVLIEDELSVDKFHVNGDRIYRAIRKVYHTGSEEKYAIAQAPLAPALKQDYAEVEEALCFNFGNLGTIRYKEKIFQNRIVGFAGSSFFKVFSYHFVAGDQRTVLNDPHSVVITDEIAQKYFPDENPVGKIIRVKNDLDLKVTGVVEKPTNSHLYFDLVVPFELYRGLGVDIDTWNRSNYTVYVMLYENTSGEEFNLKIADYYTKYFPEDDTKLELQPLKDIYLYSDYQYEVHTVTSSVLLIYFLSGLALFILLIACINFINLTTARSARRITEVGLRKVVGAYRKQLVLQFLGESVFFSVVALLLAAAVVEFSLPYLNNVIPIKHYTFLQSGSFTIYFGLLGVTLITGLVSGSYPAFYLSNFQPIDILHGGQKRKIGKGMLRKVLVVSQFAFSIFLIIVTITLFRQLNFFQNVDLGYNKDYVIVCSMSDAIKSEYGALKNELLRRTDIVNVTASLNLPTWTQPSVLLSEWEGKDDDKELTMYHCSVDYDYFETLEIELVGGRPFSRDFPTDIQYALIANEEAVRQMNMEDPVGKRVQMWGRPDGIIIGVTKDYNYNSLHNRIGPMILVLEPKETDYLIIRIKPDNIQSTVQYIRQKWNVFDHEDSFNYQFLDDVITKLYLLDRTLFRIFNIATCLSLFISCMGLLGLATYSAEQRTKEIGIRKVLGASGKNVFIMLSKEFVTLLFLASVIACPIGYFAMRVFLQQSAYGIHPEIGILIASSFIAFLIALCAICYHTFKASRANPVDSLRYEKYNLNNTHIKKQGGLNIGDGKMKNSLKKCFLYLLLIITMGIPSGVFAQGEIKGTVVEAVSKKPLANTNIVVVGTQRGASTGQDGRFSIPDLAEGIYSLEASYFGFRKKVIENITVAGNTSVDVIFELEETVLSLGEVIITPGHFSLIEKEPVTSNSLRAEDMRSFPQLGEDIYRAATRLPGVGGNDFSSRFTIRGGEHDEILVLFDGVELYDPFHLKDIDGFLSVIDVEAIRSIDMITGGFPAEYGNRLSGVFNMKTVTPSRDNPRTSIAISFLNARFLSEGNFNNGNGKWLFLARRGYFDLLLQRLQDEDDEDEIRPVFYDIIGKLQYFINEDHAVSAHMLTAVDNNLFLLDEGEIEVDTYYDNYYGWLKWDARFFTGLSAQTVISTGDIGKEGFVKSLEDNGGGFNGSARDFRGFSYYGIKQDWNYELSDNYLLKWGMSAKNASADHDYFFAEQQDYSIAGPYEPSEPAPFDTTKILGANEGAEFGAYLSNRFRIIQPLTVELGMRYDHASWTNDNNYSPRVNLAYNFKRNTTFRAGWGRYYQSQGINQLYAQDGDERFYPAELAVHKVAGLEHRFEDGTNLRVEIYHKKLSHLRPHYINYEGPCLNLFEFAHDDRVRLEPDRGVSKGFEIYVNRLDKDKFNWWASYGYAKVEEVVDGTTIPWVFDQRHTIYLDVNYRPTKDWSLNTSWQYHSGWPHTATKNRITEWYPDGSYALEWYPGPLFAERLPSYQRMDIRATRFFNTSHGRLSVFFEIRNFFDRENVSEYDYDHIGYWSGQTQVRKRGKEGFLPRLPSFGISFDFK
ncbi:TonB-dependent receptor domain-containing protein [candidate division KSB1 bacterium]